MAAHTSRSTRGFWSLVVLQGQGAFSDNLYRMLILIYIGALVGPGQADVQGSLNSLIMAFFPLAYLLFSCWAGFLADRFSKRKICLAIKFAEIGIMTLGFLVFVYGAQVEGANWGVFYLSAAVLFLMFSQSAIFGPSKYGIIPELVETRRLSWANGLINMTTFLAIILGLALAPELYRSVGEDRLYLISLGLIALSSVGLAAGFGIDRTPPANPTRSIDVNFFPELWRYVKTLWRDRVLLHTVFGLSYFWTIATVIGAHLTVWGMNAMGLDEVAAGRLYWVLMVGIAAGSGLTGVLSRNRIETGLIPLGAIGIAIAAIPLAFATPDQVWIMAGFLFVLGAAGGLFVVPLNAILQEHTELQERGGLIAASNYYTQVFTLAGMAIYFVLIGVIKLHPNHIFYFIAVATFAAMIVTLRLTPEAFVRFAGFLLTHLIYRIRTLGLKNLPRKGGVLLISNHVSFVDALLLQAVSPRPIRFVAHDKFFQKPLVGWFLRVTRSIPVASEQRPRDLIASLKSAGEALAAGEVICIFAEGQITRTGRLLPFRRGYEYILKQHPAPIVPVCLEGVWGSIFSFESGRFFWKFPRQLPYPVLVAFGAPMPAETDAHDLREQIQELGAEAAIARTPQRRLIHHQFVKCCRRRWFRFAMTDMLTEKPLNWGAALVRSIILARRLKPVWGEQPTVGILLPPSVGGALVNYAATLSGRTVVNLNYTIGQSALEDCARRAGLKTVVTARKFLERVDLAPPATAIYIEEYVGYRGPLEVVAAAVAAVFFPVRAIERFCGGATRPEIDDLATLIYSSGSTGVPKGVMLSHGNIAANIDQINQAVRFYSYDRMLGKLPFFHSFGYTVALWGGPLIGFGLVYHANPIDTRTIGELCRRHSVTVIITTATFMQQYLRRIPASDFGSLTGIIAGAEKLPERLSQAIKDKFGIEPLEGYGCTELSPVVSVNTDDFRSTGIYQMGHKRGSIGHPLPGVAVRIYDPDSGARLGANQPGLLWVKGPNVMRGYHEMPEKTAEVLRDGWYNTGDMAMSDDDGFLFITGRLSRFSKIGGEMVPHGAIEERFHELLGLEEMRLVVTAVPDEAKGEALVVLHTLDETQIDQLYDLIPTSGLPNLFVPRRDMVFKVDELPVLGTGKLDLKGVEKLAQEIAAGRA